MVLRTSEIASHDLPAVLRKLKRKTDDQTSLYVVVCIDEATGNGDQSQKIASIVEQANVLRESDRHAAEHLSVADLLIDRERFEVTRAGRPIHLSLTEFRLLEMLVRNHDQVLDAGHLARTLFGGQPLTAACNILWVYIHRLRRKIDSPPSEPLIRTIRRRGYMLRSPESARASLRPA